VAELQGMRALTAPRNGLAGWLRRFEPAMLLWLALIAVLVFLVANPMVRLIVASFQASDSGAPTLANYGIAYGNLRSLSALFNSLLYGVAVTLVAIVFAVPIAWAVSRTDIPAKGMVGALILGAFITPSYLGAISWILLAGPNSGWLNRIWIGLTGGSTGLLDIYSFGGLVFVTALYPFPYIFVFVTDALDLLSSEMEEAAKLGLGYPFSDVNRLVGIVGPAFAKEIFYSGRQFTATEALQMGLVNRVVPGGELEGSVRALADTIAGNAPLSIAATKRCVGEALKDADRRDIAACEAAVAVCYASADYVEGRTAFMEKRRPIFQAR
jgi:ABC-type spermidine/putrescine transport system permease subunit II